MKKERLIDIAILITIRKSIIYKILSEKMSDEKQKNEIKINISNMKNECFMSTEERENNKINPKTPIGSTEFYQTYVDGFIKRKV